MVFASSAVHRRFEVHHGRVENSTGHRVGQRRLVEELCDYAAAHAMADQDNVPGAWLRQDVLHCGVKVLPFSQPELVEAAWVLGLSFVVTVGDV